MNKLTLKQALHDLNTKKISSPELITACQQQISSLDPQIHAFLTLNPHPKSAHPGPLEGIPLALKDNILTKGLKTTAASKVLEDYVPPYNATVTARLLENGAVILGKNNLDAWAHGSSTETSDFGPTKNPWNTQHLPEGSSGGTAAAVASDMTIAGIGTETAGSIRQPSAWCGVVGLKPTYGRVSRYGIVAMGSSLDSPGPITKTVEDAAILLNILAGPDQNDATTSPLPVEDYTKNLQKGVKGLKIAIAQNYLVKEMDALVKQLVLQAAQTLESLGAYIEEIELMDPHFAIAVYTIIQRSEVSSNLARYDGIRYGNDRGAFGDEAIRRQMLGTHSLSTGYYDAYYKKAQKVRTLYIQNFNQVFQSYDAIISPTSPGTAKKLGATQGQAMFGELEDLLLEPSSLAGLPGINVPCGFIAGLPVGLDIVGPQFSESKILQIAQAFEQATDYHLQKPNLPKNILPTLNSAY